MKKVKLFEQYIEEATTSWGKMMKGVKAGNGGPWSIVAIQDRKVVGQSNDIKIQDLIPAKYEALKAEFPKAKFHIEDGGGQVVWNESYINEALAATSQDKLTNHDTLTPKVNATLISNARNGILKKMTEPGGKTHYWNPETKEYVAKTVTYNGKGEYLYSDAIDKDGNLTESFMNEAKDSTRDELMNLLETKYKLKTVRTSEDFNGQTEGIWIAADNDEELSGNKIFDYYNRSSKYSNGVLTQLRTAIEKKGWWFEWNDPGTIMIWPKN